MINLIHRPDGRWEETEAEVGCKFIHKSEHDRAVEVLREDVYREAERANEIQQRLDNLRRGLQREGLRAERYALMGYTPA